MIEVNELRTGLLVWWSTDCWSCPCIVTEVNEDSFRVRSLDDLSECQPLRMHNIPNADKSSRSEMRISTEEEVRQYIEDRRRKLEDEVTRTKRALNDAKKKLKAYSEKATKFVNDAVAA